MAKPEIRFCINSTPDASLPEIINWWRACDKAGIHAYGVSDSPIRGPELYATTALCALNTSRMGVMTCVTNSVTRHPSVAASGLLTLDALAPGRISMGIATGDSAVWGVGLKPASVEALREYILAVKGLTRGEQVTYQGKVFGPEWSSWAAPKDIPVYVACSGPKALKMAAQVADGLIIAMGFSDEDVQYVRNIINEGCAEVGRNPAELKIWWNAYVVFAPSIEEAMEKSLGWSMTWIAMTTMEGKGIPEEYRERLQQLTSDRHDLTAVYKTVNRHQILVERAKELGLYDWLISRSPRLFGTPDDVSKRLIELAGNGLTDWMFYVTGPEPDRHLLLENLSNTSII